MLSKDTISNMNDLSSQAVRAISFREKIEKMSILAGEFNDLLKQTREEYRNMQSPIHRNTYNILLSKLVSEILASHAEDKDIFLEESLLSSLADVLQRKIVAKLKTCGQIWDSSITDKVCKMLSHTPVEERNNNKDFLKCVAELPAFHPLRAGPGSWHSIHTIAMNVKTPEDHRRACDYIRAIQENFYCEACKEHFGKYLDEHPPENLLRAPRNNVFLEVINGETGETFVVTKLFNWTVEFHNAVNAHKTKYIESKSVLTVSLPQAYRIYYLKQYDTCQDCKVKR